MLPLASTTKATSTLFSSNRQPAVFVVVVVVVDIVFAKGCDRRGWIIEDVITNTVAVSWTDIFEKLKSCVHYNTDDDCIFLLSIPYEVEYSSNKKL